MKKKFLLIILAALLILSGCKSLFTHEGNLLSSARRAEKAGNYHAAVLNTVESLRIDNEYKKAITFLMDVYPRANSFYALKVDEKRASGGNFVNDEIVKYFQNLKDINEAVRTLPTLTNPQTKTPLSFTYTDYTADLTAARELAAEDHYREGLRFFSLKGRENAKAAALQFEKAAFYVPGYKDAEAKARLALEAGTQVLAFFPFVNNAWNIPTAQFSDIVLNTIISDLLSDKDVMKFTKIIDRGMQEQIIQEQLGSLNPMMDDQSRVAIGQLLNSNILVSGTIDSARLEGPATSMNQYRRTVEIEVEESGNDQSGYYKNENTDSLEYGDDETAVYATEEIEADVFYYRKSITFQVAISYKAIDVETGMILKSDTISILSEDSSEWAEWSGNEEALSWEDRQLINTYEQSVMSAQQISIKAAEEAGKKIAEGLASFLK